ncbi:hypothetical protein BDW22DRAFT_1431447 [Trametopsis cervina]|nr:hypothetical protein BDW22DRAFT_1431447 [Trametopsis cervina]
MAQFFPSTTIEFLMAGCYLLHQLSKFVRPSSAAIQVIHTTMHYLNMAAADLRKQTKHMPKEESFALLEQWQHICAKEKAICREVAATAEYKLFHWTSLLMQIGDIQREAHIFLLFVELSVMFYSFAAQKPCYRPPNVSGRFYDLYNDEPSEATDAFECDIADILQTEQVMDV